MVVSCCVINCTTRFNNSDPKSFYRVPKKPDTRRQLWISAIKREGPEGKPWEPADHDRVCYRHFITGQKSNDKSNPDYVPSIHMGGYEGTTTNGQLRAARFERFQKREADKDQQEAASVLLDISENLPPPTETTEKVDVELNKMETKKDPFLAMSLKTEVIDTHYVVNEKIEAEKDNDLTKTKEITGADMEVEKTVIETDLGNVLVYENRDLKEEINFDDIKISESTSLDVSQYSMSTVNVPELGQPLECNFEVEELQNNDHTVDSCEEMLKMSIEVKEISRIKVEPELHVCHVDATINVAKSDRDKQQDQLEERIPNKNLLSLQPYVHLDRLPSSLLSKLRKTCDHSSEVEKIIPQRKTFYDKSNEDQAYGMFHRKVLLGAENSQLEKKSTNYPSSGSSHNTSPFTDKTVSRKRQLGQESTSVENKTSCIESERSHKKVKRGRKKSKENVSLPEITGKEVKSNKNYVNRMTSNVKSSNDGQNLMSNINNNSRYGLDSNETVTKDRVSNTKTSSNSGNLTQSNTNEKSNEKPIEKISRGRKILREDALSDTYENEKKNTPLIDSLKEFMNDDISASIMYLLKQMANEIEEYNIEMTAWVVIPGTDGTRNVHYIGTKIGKRFMRTKPDLVGEFLRFIDKCNTEQKETKRRKQQEEFNRIIGNSLDTEIQDSLDKCKGNNHNNQSDNQKQSSDKEQSSSTKNICNLTTSTSDENIQTAINTVNIVESRTDASIKVNQTPLSRTVSLISLQQSQTPVNVQATTAQSSFLNTEQNNQPQQATNKTYFLPVSNAVEIVPYPILRGFLFQPPNLSLPQAVVKGNTDNVQQSKSSREVLANSAIQFNHNSVVQTNNESSHDQTFKSSNLLVCKSGSGHTISSTTSKIGDHSPKQIAGVHPLEVKQKNESSSEQTFKKVSSKLPVVRFIFESSPATTSSEGKTGKGDHSQIQVSDTKAQSLVENKDSTVSSEHMTNDETTDSSLQPFVDKDSLVCSAMKNGNSLHIEQSGDIEYSNDFREMISKDRGEDVIKNVDDLTCVQGLYEQHSATLEGIEENNMENQTFIVVQNDDDLVESKNEDDAGKFENEVEDLSNNPGQNEKHLLMDSGQNIEEHSDQNDDETFALDSNEIERLSESLVTDSDEDVDKEAISCEVETSELVSTTKRLLENSGDNLELTVEDITGQIVQADLNGSYLLAVDCDRSYGQTLKDMNECYVQNVKDSQRSFLQKDFTLDEPLNEVTLETVETPLEEEINDNDISTAASSNDFQMNHDKNQILEENDNSVKYYATAIPDDVCDEVIPPVIYTVDLIKDSTARDHNYMRKKEKKTKVQENIQQRGVKGKKGQLKGKKKKVNHYVRKEIDSPKTIDKENADSILNVADIDREKSADLEEVCAELEETEISREDSDIDNDCNESLPSDSDKNKPDSDEDWTASESEYTDESDLDSVDSLWEANMEDSDWDVVLGCDSDFRDLSMNDHDDTSITREPYFTRRSKRKEHIVDSMRDSPDSVKEEEEEDEKEKDDELSEDEKTMDYTEKCRFECQSCGKYFNEKTEYESHLKADCSGEKSYKPPKQEASSLVKYMNKYAYICTMCNKRLHSTLSLKNHVIKMHTRNKPHKCGLCPAGSKTIIALEKHFQKKHPEEKIIASYTCEWCGQSFNDCGIFKTHENSHKSSKRSTCPVCQKGFNYKDILRDHIKKEHVNYTPFICHLCGKGIQNNAKLEEHIKKEHTGEFVPFRCPHCPKEFSVVYYLKKHLVRHTSHKKCICEVCGKRFFSHSELRQHVMLCHEGGLKKPFKCEICEKKFASKNKLQYHMRSHTGDRPFVCKVCSKGYMSEWNLKVHMRLHTGENPYVCGCCGIAFPQKIQLKLHNKSDCLSKKLQTSEKTADMNVSEKKKKRKVNDLKEKDVIDDESNNFSPKKRKIGHGINLENSDSNQNVCT